MSGARVESIDALKFFRIALLKFAEVVVGALNHAESEVDRTLIWLEGEQKAHWQGQIRKRTELVNKARQAVNDKKLYKTFDGRPQSAVEEEQALAVAIRRLEEANIKYENVVRHTRRLHKESLLFKGQLQRLGTLLQTDLPMAVARLDEMVKTLEAYVSLAPGEVGTSETAAAGSVPPTEAAPSMRRPEALEEMPPGDKVDPKPAGDDA
jgi:hypothetical protein